MGITSLLAGCRNGAKEKAKKGIRWAKSHLLPSCLVPPVVVVDRLPIHRLQDVAENEYEASFIPAVVRPGEIGVKFDDVGALEDVKMELYDLVILPIQRPELFTHGNLLRPCKGILLFGPPGTGKTLLAKALATEVGAYFICITGSNLTSRLYGDAEKFTKALFSFARKLAPAIIFMDEIDSLLGARGGASEHEATRRIRNEFMAAWEYGMD